LTLIRFNCPIILLTMLQKTYIRKISPSALKTFRNIISNANIDAIMENNRDTIDDIKEIYSLYVSIASDNDSTEWED
tara:strand:- start:213 stop:443 length:231 start_codon:yes stop_codon:yes gene_type:complete